MAVRRSNRSPRKRRSEPLASAAQRRLQSPGKPALPHRSGARLSGRSRPVLPAAPAAGALASAARYSEPRAGARCVGPGFGPAPARLRAGSFRLFPTTSAEQAGGGSPRSGQRRRPRHSGGDREGQQDEPNGWTAERHIGATATWSTSTTATSSAPLASTESLTTATARVSAARWMLSASSDRVNARGTGRGLVRSIGQPFGASAASTRCRVPRRTARPAATRASACRDTPRRLDRAESPSVFSRTRRRCWICGEAVWVPRAQTRCCMATNPAPSTPRSSRSDVQNIGRYGCRTFL